MSPDVSISASPNTASSSKKPVIRVTEAAGLYMAKLIETRGKATFGIRIGLQSKGCASLKYVVEYVDSPLYDDTILEFFGVRVVINKKDMLYLLGSEIQYVESDFEEGLKFINPNAKGSCGCGESFTV